MPSAKVTYEVDEANRRPLKSRGWALAQGLTKTLTRWGFTPNGISLAGMLVAFAAGMAFVATAHVEGTLQRACWCLGAVGVQMRLLANLLDGMVAVHSKKASALGEVFNEVPDRFSDLAILVGFGYAASSSPTLGALSAAGAILTAYLRAFGASLGLGQDFCGPMAKPQRMFFVTVGALWIGCTPSTWHHLGTLSATIWILALIFVGTVITSLRRLYHLSARLSNLA